MPFYGTVFGTFLWFLFALFSTFLGTFNSKYTFFGTLFILYTYIYFLYYIQIHWNCIDPNLQIYVGGDIFPWLVSQPGRSRRSPSGPLGGLSGLLDGASWPLDGPSSRKAGLQPIGRGVRTVRRALRPLEVPSGPLDRASGPLGRPLDGSSGLLCDV